MPSRAARGRGRGVVTGARRARTAAGTEAARRPRRSDRAGGGGAESARTRSGARLGAASSSSCRRLQGPGPPGALGMVVPGAQQTWKRLFVSSRPFGRAPVPPHPVLPALSRRPLGEARIRERASARRPSGRLILRRGPWKDGRCAAVAGKRS